MRQLTLVDHFLPVVSEDIKAIEVVLPIIMVGPSKQVDLLIIVNALMPSPRGVLLPCGHHLLPSVSRQLFKVCISADNHFFNWRLLCELWRYDFI